MRRLPKGYRIVLVDCPEGWDHDAYVLAFGRRALTMRCAFEAPSWWITWRLRSKARSYVRRGVTHDTYSQRTEGQG